MRSKFLSSIVWAIMILLVLTGCNVSEQASQSPEQVVKDFYSWYLDNLGYDPETEEFRNPLQDGSYREHGALTQDFIDRIEEMKASGLQADPLLCAQDVPESFAVQEIDISPMGEEARVRVETSFEGHQFEVYLQDIDGTWKIASVICMP